MRRSSIIACAAGLGVAAILAMSIGSSRAAPLGDSKAAAPSEGLAKKPRPTPTTKASKVLAGTGIARLGPLFQQASGYERYAYVLVSRHDARRAARLPGTTLVYLSGTDIQKSWSTGVTHAEALEHDWLLKDGTGAYLMNAQFGSFVGDIGDPAYQRRFLENTLTFLKQTKVDGVFIDNILADPASFTGRVYPTKYPNGEAWESATVSFTHTVGKALKARGYYVLANAAKFISDDARSDTGEHVAEFWKRIAPGVSGLMSEYWLQEPDDHAQLRVLGPNWNQHWDGWQRLVSVAQAQGVDFFGLTYGSARDTRTMRYTRASFLLDWDGRGGALVYSNTDNVDPHHPAWVRQLGKPLRPKVERAPGVWQRPYEKGTVVVNATSAPRGVLVHGARYRVAGADALFVLKPRS